MVAAGLAYAATIALVMSLADELVARLSGAPK
jgi:hypothetical protein